MRSWFGSFVWIGVGALAGATLAAYFGERSWAFELTAHFRPHLVAISFVWLFLSLFQHRPVAVTACAALLALNAAPLVPYVAGGSHERTEDGTPVRVMTYNMHGRATGRAALLDYIQAEQPHIVLLTELPPAADWLLDGLGADYPYRADSERRTPHDLLLLSRWPIVGSRIDRSADPELPVLVADLCAPGEPANVRCMRLVGLHALAPFGRLAERQDRQFGLAGRLARDAPHGHAVLAGDLNMTPWAPRFGRLLETGRLVDAALGRGITATWLSRQPMVGLAIDHVLASPGVGVRDYQVGPDLGSDHLPVIAELLLPESEEKTRQERVATPPTP